MRGALNLRNDGEKWRVGEKGGTEVIYSEVRPFANVPRDLVEEPRLANARLADHQCCLTISGPGHAPAQGQLADLLFTAHVIGEPSSPPQLKSIKFLWTPSTPPS